MKKFVLILAFLLICNLGYTASEWDKAEVAGTRSVSDIDYYIVQNNTALDRLLANYNTVVLVYNSASQITASIGEVVCSNSDGSTRKMRQNTSATTITWADIDTGAEAGSTTYYIYANADADATTATFKISLSSTSPTGVTSYKKIGSFYNDSSSNIDRTKIYTNAYLGQPTDSSGVSSITGIYDYGTSASSSTFKTGGVKLTYGTLSVGANSTGTISNLPFTSSSTFSCSATFEDTVSFDDGYAGCIPASGSTLTITNHQGSTRSMAWLAYGY